MGKGRETFRKIITASEIIEQVNPKNTQYTERFLKNFANTHSPKSVVVYRSNLNILNCWSVLYNDNKFFVDFKKYELMDFFDFCLSDLKWHSQRFAQMHSCLSSYSQFIERMYDERFPNFRNLLPFIEKPVKSAVRKKSVFTKEELDKLMDWLGERNRVNEQCLLALIMATGSRASELVRFKTSIIDESNTAFEGLFLETTEEVKVKGRGVDGKHILRYIIKDIFLPYYKKWLPIRERIMAENGQEHDYIFIKKNGEPATESTIRGWVEKWDKALDKHWYIHAGRHFWCTYLLSIGLEKELVQSLQDWSSDSLVTLYCDTTAKDRKWKGLDKLKAALEQESLRAELEEIEEENKKNENNINNENNKN